MSGQNERSAVAFKIMCNGKEVDKNHLVSFDVTLDLNQPDMCCIRLRNDGNEYSNEVALANEVSIETSDGKPIFKGELVGLDTAYQASGENTVSLMAFNALHRLLRVSRSQTFQEMNDAAIVDRVVKIHPLKAQCGELAKKITHNHVYQTNQTDLQFLRVRAAKLGYDIWIEDNKTLCFDGPRMDADPEVTLRYGDAKSAIEAEAVFLKHFSPRLSSAGMVEQVEVRGWDPIKKEEIIGTFKSGPSQLGGKSAFSATSSGFQGVKSQSFEVDQPVHSIDEAKALAESKFRASAMGYITGQGQCRGCADIRPGILVNVIVNPDSPEDRFNGKYFVSGANHRYTAQGTGTKQGYITDIRVRRDAEGGG